ncbi:MAG: hypothetical protein ACI361_08565 [Atopobiaceae bacterium]
MHRTVGARKPGMGRILALLGAAFLVAAAIIGVKGFIEGKARQSESAELISRIMQDLDETSIPASGGEAQTVPSELPVLELEGTDIAGRLEISSIGLDVPVAADSSAAGLLPYLSAERTSSLAIQGESYQGDGAFGRIDTLTAGTTVSFREMDGTTARFLVMGSGTLADEFNDSYDLIIYWKDAFGTKHWAGCSLAS